MYNSNPKKNNSRPTKKVWSHLLAASLMVVLVTGVLSVLTNSLNQPTTANAQGTELAWKKVQGLPKSVRIKDTVEHNNQVYILTSGYKCEECGVFKLNESTLTVEKVLPNPAKPNQAAAAYLGITPAGEYYTYGSGGINKYNPTSKEWEGKLGLLKNTTNYRINSSNRFERGVSLMMHTDGQIYGTVDYLPEGKIYSKDQDSSPHQNFVVKFNPTTNLFEKIGPAIPEFEGTSKTGQPAKHPTWDPRIAFDANGTIFVSNTFGTSVAQCDKAPTQTPTNFIMRLKGNTWESIGTPDKGFQGRGYTCGWGNASVTNVQGELHATGGSGQSYVWNNATEKWNVLDEKSYGANRPGYSIELAQKDFTYTLPIKIEGQSCEVYRAKNIYRLSNSRAVLSQIHNQGTQNCGNGFPSPATIQDPITSEQIAQKLKEKFQSYNRGLYYMPLNESMKVYKNLEVKTASYLFSAKETNEDSRSIALQDNNEVVIGANMDSVPAGVTKFSVSGATNSTKARLIRLRNNGTEVISVTTLAGNQLDQIMTTPDNKIVAIGDFGLVVLNPAATEVLWSKDLGTYSKERRIAVSTDGKIASLNEKTVQIWSPTGQQLGSNLTLGDSYVEDIALDGQKNIVYIGGFNNGNNGNPVQTAFVYSFNINNNQRLNTTWGYESKKLGDNMADTRVYRLALSPDNNKLYAAGESAGGNTIFRWNGKDLTTQTGRNTGAGGFNDMWMAKSSAHLAYIAEISTQTGEVLNGSFNTAVLRNKQRLNTTRVRGGGLAVDAKGLVYLTGVSASEIPGKASWSIAGQKVDNGMAGIGYAGGDAYVLVLNSGLNTRLLWTTFGKDKHAGDMKDVATRGNNVAVTSSLIKGSAITTANALQKNPGEDLIFNKDKTVITRDIFFSVWDNTAMSGRNGSNQTTSSAIPGEVSNEEVNGSNDPVSTTQLAATDSTDIDTNDTNPAVVVTTIPTTLEPVSKEDYISSDNSSNATNLVNSTVPTVTPTPVVVPTTNTTTPATTVVPTTTQAIAPTTTVSNNTPTVAVANNNFTPVVVPTTNTTTPATTVVPTSTTQADLPTGITNVGLIRTGGKVLTGGILFGMTLITATYFVKKRSLRKVNI